MLQFMGSQRVRHNLATEQQQNRNRLTDIETCGCKQEEEGRGIYWEVRVGRWINNEVLRYSTGNYIQYTVINRNGKEYIKEYICIIESLCYISEIGTTL